ncbi:MAG: 16S rRNA (uracil(1498)-N(3))-methyltransferase [Magnetococcales bacterium]|nr:16S rRNA (uracil(1498)-N(3))-methyltransferase [Magnetococcales bacterium]MBF0419660.1 16S rRNA (uracil(1498)-N(3))-methyltransferase [Magnetococcales bacterium]
MMKPRLFINANLENNCEIILQSEQRHYLVHTLRRKIGSEVIIFNGQAPLGEWDAIMIDSHPEVRLRVVRHHSIHRESPLAITLVTGLIKGDAMEWLLQKATELGVVSFIVLKTERTVARISDERWPAKEKRWQKIIQEATEQCRRVRLMTIHPPVSWSQLPALLPDGPRFLFWEEGEGSRLNVKQHPGQSITLLTGSEGGLTADEVLKASADMGFEITTMGPRILRAETAAVAAVTAVQTIWGDVG